MVVLMVIDAKRKEMKRFKRMKVYLVVTSETMENGRRGEDDEHQVGRDKQRNRKKHPIAKARLVAREFNTGA